MRQLIQILAVVAVLGLALAILPSCGKDLDAQQNNQPTANSVNVTIMNDAFTPNAVTINAGGTVTWQNKAAVLYSVTIDGLIDQIVQIGGSFSYTFPTPGTYVVRDRMQANKPSMTITVK